MVLSHSVSKPIYALFLVTFFILCTNFRLNILPPLCPNFLEGKTNQKGERERERERRLRERIEKRQKKIAFFRLHFVKFRCKFDYDKGGGGRRGGIGPPILDACLEIYEWMKASIMTRVLRCTVEERECMR